MINQHKKEIRRKIKILKKQFSLQDNKQKSKIIFDKLEKRNEFKEAQIIMAYWSMDDEVYTHDFILKWQHQKIFILPVVKGDNLELKTFSGIDDLVQGESFGIGEPSGEKFKNPQDIDVIIVPGVAFDNNNNRLGRGKAYYDKLLKTTNAFKIGVCFDFQLIDSVPVDEHDIKMDMIILDN